MTNLSIVLLVSFPRILEELETDQQAEEKKIKEEKNKQIDREKEIKLLILTDRLSGGNSLFTSSNLDTK